MEGHGGKGATKKQTKCLVPTNFLTQESLWTCEREAKVRTSQKDALPDTACQFNDVQGFMNEKDINQMKKVKAKNGMAKFEKWLEIGKKATPSTHVFCCKHLKKRLVSCGCWHLFF